MWSWRAKATRPWLAGGDTDTAMAVPRIVTVATLILTTPTYIIDVPRSLLRRL